MTQQKRNKVHNPVHDADALDRINQTERHALDHLGYTLHLRQDRDVSQGERFWLWHSATGYVHDNIHPNHLHAALHALAFAHECLSAPNGANESEEMSRLKVQVENLKGMTERQREALAEDRTVRDELARTLDSMAEQLQEKEDALAEVATALNVPVADVTEAIQSVSRAIYGLSHLMAGATGIMHYRNSGG